VEVSKSTRISQHVLREYVLKSRPVILRGLPELFEPGEGLLQSLANKFGERLVTSWATPNGDFWATETLPGGGHARSTKPAEVPLLVKDIIQLLQRNASELGIVLYGQHINLDRELPELSRTLFEAQHEFTPLLAASLRRVNLWLAPVEEHLSSHLHWDEHDSLLYQLQCSKEFLLFPPGDKENLPYPPQDEQDAKHFALQWNFNITDGAVQWHLEQLTKAISNAASLMDLSEQDIKRFPSLVNVLPPKKCTVKAGDALLLPAFWHHQVRSFRGQDADDSCSCVNAAVNFWHRPLYSATKAAEVAAASLQRPEL